MLKRGGRVDVLDLYFSLGMEYVPGLLQKMPKVVALPLAVVFSALWLLLMLPMLLICAIVTPVFYLHHNWSDRRYLETWVLMIFFSLHATLMFAVTSFLACVLAFEGALKLGLYTLDAKA